MMSTAKKLVAVTVAVTIGWNNIHALSTQSGNFIGAQMFSDGRLPTFAKQWVPYLYVWPRGGPPMKFEGTGRFSTSRGCMGLFTSELVVVNAIRYVLEHGGKVVTACKLRGLVT